MEQIPSRIVVWLAAILGIPNAVASVWYVDADNESIVQDGESWSTAYAAIQPAIDAAAAAGSPGEIWVAEGTYSEMRNSKDDSGAIVLFDSLSLFGGFDGDETVREQRNWRQNSTKLDGSTSRSGEAAYHVVVLHPSSTLDGFSITGGKAFGTLEVDRTGGGVSAPEGEVIVRNCRIYANEGLRSGGGIFAGSGTSIENCDFELNRAGNDGGAILALSDCLIQKTRFVGNRSGSGAAMTLVGAQNTVSECLISESVGGGAVFVNGPRQRFINVQFSFNRTENGDGGAISGGGARHEFINCLFANNTAAGRGGAVHYTGVYDGISFVWNGGPIFANCTFAGNRAEGGGGAIFADKADVTLHNSVVWDNGANPLLVPEGFPPSRIRVSYSLVEGGLAGEGNLDADPLFVNPSVMDYRLTEQSPAVDAGTQEASPPDSRGNSVEVPEDDLEGTTRPQGAGIDIGAYEFIEGQPTRYLLEVATEGMGEVVSEPAPGLLDENTEVTLTATPAEGYAFARWEGDLPEGATATDNPLTFSITQNTTLTAVFESLVAQVTLTIAAEGMGTVDPPVGEHTYDEGTEVTLTATPANGYGFAGWDGAVMTDTNPLDYTVIADATISALFRQQFTLTTQTDGHGSITPFEGTQTFLEGETITLEATGNSDYLFDQWTGDLPTPEAVFDNPLTFTLTTNTTLTATFIAAPWGCKMSAGTNPPVSANATNWVATLLLLTTTSALLLGARQ